MANQLAILTKEDWRKIGAYANKLIQNDFAVGKFQNNRSGLSYRSQEYKRYKVNGMKKISGQGRLKIYYGQPIESTNVSFVDMTLTGRLKKSLAIKQDLPNGIRSGYSTSDKNPGKILGNRRYGREVLGLSDENQKKVKVLVVELMRAHIKDFNQNINIKVSF